MVTIQKNKKIAHTPNRNRVYSKVSTKLSKGWTEAAGIWKGKKMQEALKHRASTGREWEKRLEKMYRI